MSQVIDVPLSSSCHKNAKSTAPSVWVLTFWFCQNIWCEMICRESLNWHVYPSDVNCQVQMSQICKLFLSHLSYSKSFNWHVLIISVKNLQVNSQYLQSVSWNVKTASCFPHVRMCEEWFDSMQRSIRIILIDHNFPSVNVYLVSIIAKLSLQIPLAE